MDVISLVFVVVVLVALGLVLAGVANRVAWDVVVALVLVLLILGVL